MKQSRRATRPFGAVTGAPALAARPLWLHYWRPYAASPLTTFRYEAVASLDATPMVHLLATQPVRYEAVASRDATPLAPLQVPLRRLLPYNARYEVVASRDATPLAPLLVPLHRLLPYNIRYEAVASRDATPVSPHWCPCAVSFFTTPGVRRSRPARPDPSVSITGASTPPPSLQHQI